MGKFNQNSGYGQAVLSGVHGIRPTTGKVFLVADSSNANFNDIDGLLTHDEEGVARRYSTIDAAINACTADAGDVILVAPGHAENVAAATSIVPDVDGIQIIGLGHGANRPVLTYTATAGSIDISGANTVFKNFVLKSSISAVVVGVNVDAAGVVLEDLRFEWDETGDDFITMVDVDGVNDAEIRNCSFIAEDAAGCAEAIRLDDADNVVIENNSFYGDFTDAVIVGEGAVGTNLVIRNNDLYNSDTTAGNSIDLNVAFTGKISYNSIGTLFATAPETAFDPGSCLCVENYVVNAVDESAALVPTTVST
jgi:hypothetical protein